ncbi:alpha-amylase [Bacillus lacus]|uniref:alpha-amylase n=1 Tax=Metabacillus lacus TaxID=1983721 RepID=A0A7X2LZY2_9BACI|nr:alpha-amylase family glycosyl hydrolase [Metabacillus lacus]MRX73493.1 alpha-amylase [Metabacillus lacus]
MSRRGIFKLCLIPFLLFYALPASAAEKEERAWQNEMIYFVMVDRFNNGDTSNDVEVNTKDPKAYHGGDLRGIINQLDYIKEMGFTSIWLTPIFENEPGGYHGYWISDFMKVEEHFGTLDDMKELVEKAHERDMKIILDFVANHTGYQHEWLNDSDKAGWFHENQPISNWDNQDDLENGWLFGLPDLDQSHPEARQYLLDAAAYWIEETDIDGYRLDTVRHVPKEFWEEFAVHVKSLKENFFLLGEVWDNDPRYLAEYEKTGIDSFVDYPLYEEMGAVFSEPDKSIGPLYDVWRRNEAYYQNPYLLGTFLDNHDNVRFTRKAIQKQQHPGTRLKMALSYLYTAPGIPIVYYGTEIAMDGGEDPDNRQLMNFRTDDELNKYIGKLASIRKEFSALTEGNFEMLYDQGGMAVFKRTANNEQMIIALNNSSKAEKAVLDSSVIAENKELKGLLLDDSVAEQNGAYEIVLDRETAEIYRLEDKTGINYSFISVIVLIPVLFAAFLFANRRKKNHQ